MPTTAKSVIIFFIIYCFLIVLMVYSKNQTKILFFGEFNENKLNYICGDDTNMPKKAANTTKG